MSKRASLSFRVETKDCPTCVALARAKAEGKLDFAVEAGQEGPVFPPEVARLEVLASDRDRDREVSRCRDCGMVYLYQHRYEYDAYAPSYDSYHMYRVDDDELAVVAPLFQPLEPGALDAAFARAFGSNSADVKAIAALARGSAPERERAAARKIRLHKLPGGAGHIQLVYVPAGDFLMGDGKWTMPMEQGFWIGRFPTTWREYEVFCTATRRAKPNRPDRWSRAPGMDDPVVNVSWDDVIAFCQWAGLDLPTEAEWEKAARGTDGRVFPWGDDPPTSDRCVFREFGSPYDDWWDSQYGDGADPPQGTSPVVDASGGPSRPRGASPFGAYDMAGNVWEWCRDPSHDSSGRALRGGSYGVNLVPSGDHGDTGSCRSAFRYPNRLPDPAYGQDEIGFRVCLREPDVDADAVRQVEVQQRERSPSQQVSDIDRGARQPVPPTSEELLGKPIPDLEAELRRVTSTARMPPSAVRQLFQSYESSTQLADALQRENAQRTFLVNSIIEYRRPEMQLTPGERMASDDLVRVFLTRRFREGSPVSADPIPRRNAIGILLNEYDQGLSEEKYTSEDVDFHRRLALAALIKENVADPPPA